MRSKELNPAIIAAQTEVRAEYAEYVRRLREEAQSWRRRCQQIEAELAAARKQISVLQFPEPEVGDE